MKKKLVLMSVAMLFMLFAIAPASAAVELEVTKTAFDDFSLSVHVKGLTDGTTYYLWTSPDEGTTNTTQVDWIADSSGENTFFFSVSTPADKTLEVYVGTTENGAAADSATVYYPDDDDNSLGDSIESLSGQFGCYCKLYYRGCVDSYSRAFDCRYNERIQIGCEIS